MMPTTPTPSPTPISLPVGTAKPRSASVPPARRCVTTYAVMHSPAHNPNWAATTFGTVSDRAPAKTASCAPINESASAPANPTIAIPPPRRSSRARASSRAPGDRLAGGPVGGGVVKPVHVMPSHQRVGATCHGSGYQPGRGAPAPVDGSVDCTPVFRPRGRPTCGYFLVRSRRAVPPRNRAIASSSSGRARASASERRMGNHGSSLPHRTRPRYVLVFMNATRFGSM